MPALVDRRSLLIGTGAVAASALAGPVPGLAQALPSVAPAELGFAADIAEKLDAGQRSGLLGNLHGVVVVRSGRIALERYYSGPDESWGRSLGTVTFGPETLHDLRSVTKSIVSLIYGIARGRELVPPPEAPLYVQFPEYADLVADPERRRRTVEHALTMTLGLEWNEQIPYTDPANSEIAMERAQDRYRFILDRPVVAEPGTRWVYSGGTSALIGALIARGAGKSLDEFAREALFEPLGIRSFEWARGADGVPSAASGLRLTPRDQARIAQLLLARGRWGERQIVPAAWLEASFRPHIATSFPPDAFGYQWWLGEETLPAALGGRRERWVTGNGNGGQRLWLMPALDLAVIVTAGGYNQRGNSIGPNRVWREIVLGNLRG